VAAGRLRGRAGGWRGWRAVRPQCAAGAEAQASARAGPDGGELAAGDVVRPKCASCGGCLPVSVDPCRDSAYVKARVPGELQELRLREGATPCTPAR
jgi:hypothetical protein